MAEQISDRTGVGLTDNLRKYLGMPLLHSKVNRNTYGEILEKIRTRLQGWKGRCLSYAGKTLLVKSVIFSIPIYAMQTSLLPTTITVDIEKRTRNFIWVESEKRRMHLIN